MDKEVNFVKIKWIEFENLETGLLIEHLDFFDDITLLIGLSGAGKTQILDAIQYSLQLALGKVKVILYPYKVRLGFVINNHNYEWSYILKKQLNDREYLFDDINEYYFAYECLMCDGKKLFIRDNDSVSIKSFSNIPKPKKNQSLIYQYEEEAFVKELTSGLRKLYPIDIEIDIRGGFDIEKFDDLKAKVNIAIKVDDHITFNAFGHLPSIAKLYIAKNHYPAKFEQILYVVQDIFPEIEDINVIKDPIRDVYCVEITVYGKKLHQQDISNGMLKTIYYVVELYTASENSLIIIDEFENGLGMNCIDAISDLMLRERSDLQYIITSHHPKIINAIDYNNWKIIERTKNIVKNYKSTDENYDLGGNRHDAYFNLINKWSFEGKI